MANDLRYFDIPFVGLKAGEHRFAWEVDDSFFAHFGGHEFSSGRFSVVSVFEKHSAHFVLVFEISGSINVACDRCNENFTLDVDGDYRVIVKFSDENGKVKGENDDQDIVFISPADTVLNVAQLIFEYIELSIPMRKVHPENGCNPAVIRLLENLGQPDNEQQEGNNADPVWDKLRELK